MSVKKAWVILIGTIVSQIVLLLISLSLIDVENGLQISDSFVPLVFVIEGLLTILDVGMIMKIKQGSSE